MTDGAASPAEQGALKAALKVWGSRVAKAALVAAGVFAIVGRSPYLSGEVALRNDFTPDYVSARAWQAGENPYAPIADLVRRYLPDEGSRHEPVFEGHRNPHPPLQFFLSLHFLPYEGALIARWILGGALLAVALAWWLSRLGASVSTAVAVSLGSFALPVVHLEAIWGQIAGILVAALVLSLLSLRRGADRFAGCLLGLVAALKVFPLLLFIVLLRSGRRRAGVWMLATFGASSLASFLVVGEAASRDFLTSAASTNFEFWRASPFNISLVSLPFRWLSENPWMGGYPAESLAWLIYAALTAGCVFRLPRSSDAVTSVLVALPWMVLVAPLAWEWAVLLTAPLLCALWLGPDHRPMPRVGFLFLVAALVIIPSGIWMMPRPRLQELGGLPGWVIAVRMWPTVMLVLLGVYARRALKASSDQLSVGSGQAVAVGSGSVPATQVGLSFSTRANTRKS